MVLEPNKMQKLKEEDINMDYFVFNYLNIDLDNVSLILKKIFDNRKYVIRQDLLYVDLPEKPMSGGRHFPRAVFFIPKDCKDKTIMISNYSDGWITLGNIISNESNTFNYNFRLSKDENLINSLTYWNNGQNQRVVYTMKDPQWIFYEQGIPLWFEDINNYQKRYIKNRLNYEILISYCEKMGIEILNEDFFKSDKEAVYIEQISW